MRSCTAFTNSTRFRSYNRERLIVIETQSEQLYTYVANNKKKRLVLLLHSCLKDFLGTHMLVPQLLHGFLYIFIPQRVNHRVKEGSEDSKKHRDKFVNWEAFKGPNIDKD